MTTYLQVVYCIQVEIPFYVQGNSHNRNLFSWTRNRKMNEQIALFRPPPCKLLDRTRRIFDSSFISNNYKIKSTRRTTIVTTGTWFMQNHQRISVSEDLQLTKETERIDIVFDHHFVPKTLSENLEYISFDNSFFFSVLSHSRHQPKLFESEFFLNKLKSFSIFSTIFILIIFICWWFNAL